MEESAEQIPLQPRSGGAPGHPFVRTATPIAQDDVRYGLAYLQQRLDEARDADSNQIQNIQAAQAIMQQEQQQIRTAQDAIIAQLQQIYGAILTRPSQLQHLSPINQPLPPPTPPPPAGVRNMMRAEKERARVEDGEGGTGGAMSGDQKPLQVTGLEQMDPDIKLQDFATWRNRWNDFCRLQQVHSHPIASRTAALRQALGLPMQRVVDIALNIRGDGPETPDQILDIIHQHLRSKRNVALDRVDFETCTQQAGETFDDFYIRLKRTADCALLRGDCIDQRMTTRIMSGIRDSDVRKKLMSLSPFPTVGQAVNLCRSEESACVSGVWWRTTRLGRQMPSGGEKV